MRRLAAAATILLFLLVIPAMPAKAEGTTTVWSWDQDLTNVTTVEAGDTLRIESGVNVTFDVAPDVGFPDTPPSLTVAGTLVLNGTGDRPVTFHGSDAIEDVYRSPASIQFTGGSEDGPRWSSNASFTGMELDFQDCQADFSNCTFTRCKAYLGNSNITFLDCRFQTASVTGKFDDYSSRLIAQNCTFDGTYEGNGTAADRFYLQTNGAVCCSGWTTVEDCAIINYSCGVTIDHGSAEISNCTISCCTVGINYDYLTEADPYASIDIRDCDIGGSQYAAVSIQGNGNVTNCTLHGALVGIFASTLGYMGGDPPPPSLWLFSGNVFYGNGWADIWFEGKDCDVTNNTFTTDNGSSAELYRVCVSMRLIVDVSLSTGGSVGCTLNCTDATGSSFNEDVQRGEVQNSILSYSIGNDGKRTEYYPYSIYAWNVEGTSDKVKVPSGTEIVRLVITRDTDLLPLNLTVDPVRPVAGKYIAFRLDIHNLGIHNLTNVMVSLSVDGIPWDSTNITFMAANSTVSPRFLEWKATKGPHTVEVVVDPDNAVEEYNETNNLLNGTFTVGPAPQKSSPDPGRTLIWAGALVIGLAIIAAVFVRMRRKTGD